ncbi:nicotinate phosphoribosyltransferase [Malassezia japonica]|uniref:Nicotinate phosphoribosyltransferase n=1 Tax=Malassezia japonica TaxID=223818 RepID=A0AAF0F9Y5_9BASI|nr:nicotinate phosphoribosyltransferase [Malassezia japonica]WFD41017.1 nicotinate phosphoribosyltransferase [Malassezia japonica]
MTMTGHGTVQLPSLLDTDLYKLTMQQAVLQHFPDAQVTYRFTNRSKEMQFTAATVDAVRAGIEHLGTLRISAEEEAWLREACPYFQEKYLAFLRDFQLRPADEVDVRFVPTDGEYGQLEVLIQGAWASVILYEVPVMAIISETYFQTVDRDWTAAGQRERAADKARKLLQHGVMLSEFGTRRRRSLATHVEVMHGLLDAQKEVGDAPGAGRILGTSNIYLAKQFGVAPVGTVAHEWTMAIAAIHGYEHSNLRALQLWDAVYQPPAFTPARPVDDLTIALTDTFSTRVFWDDLLSSESGKEILRRWRGVRQDSGDSRVFVRHALDVYRSIGVDPAKKLVIFSDGLNVERCLELQAFAKEMGILAGFGVGTHLTNDFGCASDTSRKSRALNMVLKLDSINGHPTVKISDELTKNTGDADEIALVKRRFGLSGADSVEDA